MYKNIKYRYLIIIYEIVTFNTMKYYYLLYYYYIIKLYDLRTCVVKSAINGSRRENIIISYKVTQRRGDGGSSVPKQRLRTRSFRARFLYAAVCVVFRPPVFEGGRGVYSAPTTPHHPLGVEGALGGTRARVCVTPRKLGQLAASIPPMEG